MQIASSSIGSEDIISYAWKSNPDIVENLLLDLSQDLMNKSKKMYFEFNYADDKGKVGTMVNRFISHLETSIAEKVRRNGIIIVEAENYTPDSKRKLIIKAKGLDEFEAERASAAGEFALYIGTF